MVFYRFFNDFITIPVLMQSKNMGDLGGSITNLIRWTDVFVFVDVVLIAYLIFGKKYKGIQLSRMKLVSVTAMAVLVFFFNLSMAETVRPELLTRTFDR